MPSQLEQLSTMSTIVADTGDIEAIKSFHPQDATTNPTLILQAAQKPEYRFLIEKAIRDTQSITCQNLEERQTLLLDHVFVNFGAEILKLIPGRVSTEVDAHLSFDYEKSIHRALSLIKTYEQRGIPRDRILIKLAATWEGVRAAEVLQMEGIHCNMTLIFSLTQAAASAEAKAAIVSPFVGRMMEWHKKNKNVAGFTPQEDPGVLSVKSIYTYLKKFNYKTCVMAASFRNKEEILELAGCDLITIAPKFLEELAISSESVVRKLSKEKAKQENLQKIPFNEGLFRFMVNEDVCATDKLSEGIRLFAKDWTTLQQFIFREFPEAI